MAHQDSTMFSYNRLNRKGTIFRFKRHLKASHTLVLTEVVINPEQPLGSRIAFSKSFEARLPSFPNVTMPRVVSESRTIAQNYNAISAEPKSSHSNIIGLVRLGTPHCNLRPKI